MSLCEECVVYAFAKAELTPTIFPLKRIYSITMAATLLLNLKYKTAARPIIHAKKANQTA